MIEVTRYKNGEVIVEIPNIPATPFRTQEEAHTWLAWAGYKLVQKAVRGIGDYISGFYTRN